MATTRDLFYKFYWAMARRIVPGLRDSQYVYKDVVAAHLKPHTKWLDLGCGHHFFGHWMKKEQADVVARAGSITGLDYEFDGIRKHQDLDDRMVGDVYQLPIRDSSFDLVTANMVAEHLQRPEDALREIFRILRPGGMVILHTPNFKNYQFRLAALLPQGFKNKLIWFLENRKAEDVFPTHYKINTLANMTRLPEQAGFRLSELHSVSSSAETIMLGPVVMFELLVIRMLSSERLRDYRSNLIAVLEKPSLGKPRQKVMPLSEEALAQK